MPADVQVKSSDLRKLAKDLRRASDGKRLAKELRTGLRSAGKPLVPLVRRAIAGLPSQGQNARRGRIPLRKRMAKATKLKVKTGGKFAGVSIRVEHTAMPPGQANLPALMEGEPRFTRWRSPNWGRGDWKTQPSHPYFYAAIRSGEKRAQDEATAIVDRIAKELEK